MHPSTERERAESALENPTKTAESDVSPPSTNKAPLLEGVARHTFLGPTSSQLRTPLPVSQVNWICVKDEQQNERQKKIKHVGTKGLHTILQTCHIFQVMMICCVNL